MGKILSNLPNSSLPWGRDIEARLEKLEALVASNEINNATRDQRMETTLSKVSTLLANTAALKTYQTQLPGSPRVYSLGSTDNGVADTSDLLIKFSLDKERVVSFDYSFDYSVEVLYTSSSDTNPSWDFFSYIYVNGEAVSVASEVSDDRFLASNPYQSRTVTSVHRNSETLLLPAGDYEVSAAITFDHYSASASATMTFDGDVLSVSIIE